MKGVLSLLICLSTILPLRAGMVERVVSNLNEITLQSCVADAVMIEEFIEISMEGRFNDLMIKELYTSVILPDYRARELINSIDREGRWPIINYRDQRRSPWEPSVHLMRIYALLKVYHNESSQLYEDSELLDVIFSALEYWHTNRAVLVCNNWWYNQIFIPRYMGQIYLLLGERLTAEQRVVAIEIMNQSQFDGTGQNKVWIAGNVLMRGLLEGDTELVRQAREQIVEEIFMSLGEGLQYDNSFHQHGEQMQFGNYGLAYINSLVYWARVFQGTSLSIEEDKIEMLSGYLLDGIQWTVWRGVMDPNVAARQVFENSQRGKAYSLALSVNNMRGADSANVESYNSLLERNIYNTEAKNDLVGTNYYWHCDYFVSRSEDWFASVRMNSDRILGFEMTNRENLQGVYSSDGVMMLLLDGDEYENIYPIWDWKRLPALTCFDDGEPIPFTEPKEPINKSNFVGGVTSGAQGVATMHYRSEQIEYSKSYLFIADLIVVLGADINVDNNHPTYTTLEQRLLRDDKPITMGKKSGRSTILKRESQSVEISWLHHDKVGYYLPEPTLMELSQQSRREPWRRIADSFDPTRFREGTVFTASIKHPEAMQAGEYSYVVLPNRSSAQTKAFAENPSIEIVSNTPTAQAVVAKDGSVAGAVLYQAGAVELGEWGTVSASSPVVMLLEREEAGSRMTLADPTQKLDSLSITLTLNGVEHSVDIELPTQEGYRGSDVSTLLYL